MDKTLWFWRVSFDRILKIIFWTLFTSSLSSCVSEYENEIDLKDVVYTMGANRLGVIGDGTRKDALQPYQIIGLRDIVQIEASLEVSMALTSTGKVFAWGDNSQGQLGIGDTVKISPFPRQVVDLPEIAKISSEGAISMALDKLGNVWVWGTIFTNDYREGPAIFSSRHPVQINLSDVMDIGAGRYHCVAISKQGDVYTWGRNAVGMLGDGTSIHRLEPQKISGIANIRKISVGYYHTLALSSDNKLYAWGFNLHGELGNGSADEKWSPVLLPTIENVEDMVAGGNHNLCLLTNGTLWAWGENGSGQVGNGTGSGNVYFPTEITGLPSIKQIDASGSSSVALTNDNRFWAWGTYQFTSMQGGYGGFSRKTPTRIEKLDNAKVLATGGFHYLIIR